MLNYYFIDAVPENAMTGSYNPYLVLLSYVVARPYLYVTFKTRVYILF